MGIKRIQFYQNPLEKNYRKFIYRGSINRVLGLRLETLQSK